MIDAATCAKFYARPNKFFTSRARPYSKTEYLSAYFAKNVGIFLKERINSQYEKVVATNLLAANATGVVVPTAE